MENPHDDISFSEFDKKINSYLFETDQQVKLFQNLAQELLIQDMKVTLNEEKLAEIWKIYNKYIFHEQKINNSLSESDFNIKQVTNIVDNLEHQMNNCSITDIRAPIYCILENLFVNIYHMQELLESIWIDGKIASENQDDPVKDTKFLLKKQYNILENIQNKLDIMENLIKDIQTIKCECSDQS